MFEKIKELWNKAVSFVKDLASSIGCTLKNTWNEFSTAMKIVIGASLVFDVAMFVYIGFAFGTAVLGQALVLAFIWGCVGWCLGTLCGNFINWLEARKERNV